MGVYVQTPGELYQHEFEWQDITFVNQMMMPSTQKNATGCPLTPKVVSCFQKYVLQRLSKDGFDEDV